MMTENPNPNKIIEKWFITHDRVIIGIVAFRKIFRGERANRIEPRDYPTAEEIARLNRDENNSTNFSRKAKELVEWGVLEPLQKEHGREGATTYKPNFEALGKIFFFYLFDKFRKKKLPDNYKVSNEVIREIALFLSSETLKIANDKALIVGRTNRTDGLYFKSNMLFSLLSALSNEDAFEQLNDNPNAQEQVILARKSRDKLLKNLLKQNEKKFNIDNLELPTHEEPLLIRTAYSFWDEILTLDPLTLEKIPQTQQAIQELFEFWTRERKPKPDYNKINFVGHTRRRKRGKKNKSK